MFIEHYYIQFLFQVLRATHLRACGIYQPKKIKGASIFDFIESC